MTSPKPAWRHSGFWLVFGLLLASVVISLGMVYLSLRGRDTPVVADAYDHGLDINDQLQRSHLAARLGLSADLDYDAGTHVLHLHLQAAQPLLVHQLQLRLPHPVDAHQDVTPTLQDLGNQHYSAVLPANIHGQHYVLLSTPDWRLVGRVEFPFTHAELSAR